MLADVFLSYSHRDTEIMRRVRESLRAADFKVWNDDTDEISPGTPSWENQIETAIKDAKCVVVLFSPNAMQSKWVSRELLYAQRLNLPIFPLLAEGEPRQSVPFGFTAFQYVDIRRDYENGINKLVRAIERLTYQREVEASQKLIEFQSMQINVWYEQAIRLTVSSDFSRARVICEQILYINPSHAATLALLDYLVHIELRIERRRQLILQLRSSFVWEIVLTTVERPLAFLSFGVFALLMWAIRGTATVSITTFLVVALGVTAIVLIAFLDARSRNAQEAQDREAVLRELRKKNPTLFEQFDNDIPEWLYQDQQL